MFVIIFVNYYSKPVLIFTTTDSNYLEGEWLKRYDEKLLGLLIQSDLFEVSYEPLAAENFKELVKKEIENSNYDYVKQYLKTYNADYILFYSINRLWELEYSIHFQIIDLKKEAITFLDVYTVDRQNKIDETFEFFTNKLVENNLKKGLFQPEEETVVVVRKGWGNIWTHLLSFVLGLGTTVGIIYILWAVLDIIYIEW